MKITILILNILILAALAFLIYKLVKEEWEHLQLLEEKTEALLELAQKQSSINENALSFQKSQIEMNKIIQESIEKLSVSKKRLNLMIKSDREKLEQFDSILAQHMMDQMNYEVMKKEADNDRLPE